jgi:1-acyl-sn-glycerol-3-phosphate acyltransferase
MAEVFAIAGYYHLHKLAANLIDRAEGVLEHRISQLLARRLLSHFGYRVELSGAERLEGLERYCVVSTHGSHLDWAVLLGHFPSPLRFIAKRELATMPVIGDYLRLRGVLIDRSRGPQALATIRAAASDGQPWPILIFPEGTRSRDGAIAPFRAGGLRVLAEAGLALVPVRISGTFEAFPRHAALLRTGGTFRLAIGAPVRPDHGSLDERLALVEARVRAL